MKNSIVDYIGIGTHKAATTWIHTCINEHPSICGSNPKETHYFSKNFSKGPRWYKTCFKDCKDIQYKFEFSPGYISDKDALLRIKKYVPNAKLIVCFKNPVDRAVSAYKFNEARGAHLFKTFDKYFEHATKTNPGFVQKGNVGTSLQNAYALFGKEQVLVLFHQDIQKDCKDFVQKIYTFLGVDADFIPPSLERHVNKTVKNVTRFRIFNYVILNTRNYLNKIPLLHTLRDILKRVGINFLIKGILQINMRRPKNLRTKEKEVITEDDKQKVVSLYKEEVELLEKLTGRDLSSWKSIS